MYIFIFFFAKSQTSPNVTAPRGQVWVFLANIVDHIFTSAVDVCSLLIEKWPSEIPLLKTVWVSQVALVVKIPPA